MKLTCLESSWIFVDIFGSLEFSTISRARFWIHEYWQRVFWRETCSVGLLPLLLIPPYVRSWWSSWMRREISVFDWKSQPKPECGRRGWQRVEPPSHCWTLEGFGLFCSPLELKHSFSWAEHRLVITEARRQIVAQIRNSQVSKIW